MADPQTQQALQALSQLGAAALNGRAGLASLNQTMAKLRAEMQRGTGSVQSNAAALQSLNSGFSNLTTATQQSAAGMAMLRDAQSMAAKVTQDAAGQMAGSLLKGGLIEAVQTVSNQLLASTAAYQAGASGLDTAFASQNASIESQIRILDKLSTGAAEAAAVFALIPSPYAKGLAVLSSFVAATAAAGKGLVGLSKEHIAVLQKELQQTAAAFSIIEKYHFVYLFCL